MLRIHFANRFETLAERLVASLGERRTGVFGVDEVIVPSAALRRQLTLALAQRHGVCANVRFSYLAQWLWQLMGRVLPGIPAESPLAPALLAWRIHAVLGDAAWCAAHPRLAAYLGRADAVMRFELAEQIAGLFDQYLTYRPQWLQAWADEQPARETGDAARQAAMRHPDAAWQAAMRHPDAAWQAAMRHPDAAWQAALWHRLFHDLRPALDGAGPSPAQAFVDALAREGPALVRAGVLPAQADVFCLPTMPPVHLALLQALGGCMTLDIHALNPCGEYWFEVVEPRRLAYLAARGAAAHHEVGHRLLAAWGRQAQSALGLLVDAGGDGVVDDACFEPHPAPTLLARLHNAILALEEPAPGSVPLAEDDRSLEVHMCHSLTRELEVLHDRLLGLFAADATLQASDILVVTPNLEAAAPLVAAVFGTAPRERFIPHVLSGLARSRANPVARALLALLALLPSRWPASAVFGLLQQPVVARRFDLDEDALERVHGWLRDAGVRWARDAAHRAQCGVPAEPRHTWLDGLDRLMLGHAMPAQGSAGPPQASLTPTGGGLGAARPWGCSHGAEPLAGLLPAGDAEGGDALALGALWAFVEALRRLQQRCAAPLPAAAWGPLLAQALEQFVAADDDTLDDRREVQAALQALGAQWAASGCDEALPLELVQHALARELDDPARGGVPTGAVTFAAMSSLRHLPFRVVCMIGLDDGVFPTGTRPPEFDLMAQAPLRGDRQRRLDERNLFLDLLLAARDHLHLSYTGRSVRDNAVLPPSVLIAELLDALLPTLEGGAAAARARLVIEHPLQAFAERAFRTDAPPALRSFHAEYAQALQQRDDGTVPCPAPRAGLASPPASPGAGEGGAPSDDDDVEDDDAAPREPAQPLFTRPLPEPPDAMRRLDAAQLQAFFQNPCRALLRGRLGLALHRAEDELEDDEPFLPDDRLRRAMGERVLPALLAGADHAAAERLALAGTELPPGPLGRRSLERELLALRAHATRWQALTAEPCLPPHSAQLTLAVQGHRWQIDAGWADLRPGGLARQRWGDRRAADYLAAWIEHLLLCAAAPPGCAPQTTWLARDGRFRLRACEQPLAPLGELLALMGRGLRWPLYFFPKTAWAYVCGDDSLTKARKAWTVDRYSRFGEQGQPAFALALRGLPDPLGEGLDEFHACAHAVLDPLRAHLEDEDA